MSSYPGDERFAAEQHAKRVEENAKAYVSKSGAKSSEKLRRYWLVPLLTILDRLTPRYEEGADKYGIDNWRVGLADREWLLERTAHAVKHMALVADKMRRGVRTDSGDDDLAAVMWFCAAVAESEAVSLSPEVEAEVRPTSAALDRAFTKKEPTRG